MKKLLILLSFVLSSVVSFGQFINTQTVGRNSTDYKSLGGLTADSVVHLAAVIFADTTAANYSVASKYSGALIQVASGQIWWRSLNPNQWHIFASSTGGSYVLVSDTSTMLTPYLRKSDTLSMLSNRLRISDTAFMLSTRVKYSDTANQMSGYVRKNFPVLYTDTASMLSGYARSANVPNNQRSIATTYPLQGGGDFSINRTHSIDTGRSVPQIVTGGDLNKVRDSLQANITASVSGVSSVSVTTANGVSGSVLSPTTTPAITLTLGAITPSSVSSSGAITATYFSGSGLLLTNVIHPSDTASMLANRLKISDTAYMVSNRLKISDTLTMLSPYAHSQAVVKYYDTASMLSTRLKISDTAYMVSNRLKISDTLTMLSNRLKISDTTTMLSGYLRTGNAKVGTVTSIGLSLPSFITVTNSPITTSGTITGTLSNQSANLIFAGPTTGSAAQPTFRALTTSDIPNSYVKYTDTTAMLSGYLPLTAGVGKPLTGDLYGTGINFNGGANFSGGTVLSGRVTTGMRPDATVVIRDSTFPFMVFELTKNGLANPNEGGIAAYGRDLSSNLYKIASIALRVVDNTGGNAYGGIRLNAGTYQSGLAQDRPVFNAWGNGSLGSASMFYSGITPEADSTLKIYGALVVAGTATANKFIKSGGTSSQFLKADGNVDNTTYLPLSGGTLTGALTGTSATFTGNIYLPAAGNIYTNTTKRILTWNSLGDAYIGDVDNGFTNTIIRQAGVNALTFSGSQAATFSATVTANSFIKSGGTSSQFLKADGSVDASTYLTTSSAASTYAPLTGTGASGTWGINITGTAASETLGTVTARGNYVAPNTTGLQMDFGSIGIQSYSLNDAWVGDNVYYNGGFKYSRTGTAGRIYFQGGGIRLSTAPSGTAGTTAFFTDAISINNASGDVSIGGGSGNLSANAGTFGSTVKGLRIIGNSGTDNGIDAVQSSTSMLSNIYRIQGKIQASNATIDNSATFWNDNTNGSTVTYTLPATSSIQGTVYMFSKTGTGNLTLTSSTANSIISTTGVAATTITLTSANGVKQIYYDGSKWYQLN